MVRIAARGFNALPFTQGSSFSESLSTTATEIKADTDRMINRRAVYIRNQSDVNILWGFSSSTCYCELSVDEDIIILAAESLPVFAKAEAGSGKTIGACELR